MNSFAKRFLIFPLCAALLSVTACANDNRYNETIGTAVGGAAGAMAGSSIGGGRGRAMATVIGAVLGLIVGREAGKAIDDGFFEHATEVAQGSMDNNSDGQMTSWEDPDSDTSGTITPQTTYKNDTGEDCRDFESTMTLEGKTEVAHGRACRQSDGSWKIVN
jgi:surface antigen